jgi:biofilm PGA synthesis protein PgaA
MDQQKHALHLLLACLAPLAVASAQTADCDPGVAGRADAAYAAGLALYRAGQPAPAYEQLQFAVDQCPARLRYRDDYLVAAVTAGHADEALEAAAGLDPAALPPYVLEALGRGARDQRRAELALRYYAAIPGADDNPTVRAGRDLVLLDQGRIGEAQADLVTLQARFPDSVPVEEALGLADEAAGDWIPALAAAESILRRTPDASGALALRYRVLVHVGAPHLAAALTPESVTTPAERAATRQDELAFEFRWARDEPRPDRIRAAHLDEVIGRMREAAADPSSAADVRQRVRADLIEALQQRSRSSEAVAEYEALVRDGMTVPPYATGAAADAYLALRQPQRALDLVRSLPAGAKLPFSLKSTYFYALLESDQPHAAIAWADTVARQEPQYLDADSPGLRSDNPDYVPAQVLAALARAYTEQPADAGRRLGALVTAAPGNTDALLALAAVDALRGWPRESAVEAGAVLALHPDLGAATAQRFAAQLQAADWRAAAESLRALEAQQPAEDPLLRRAQRDWQVHDAAEFSVDAELGRSFGRRTGLIDSTIEEYAWTPPIAADWRAYAHLNQAEGDPVQGTTWRHAAGAGVEYHTADWLATVELLEIDRASPEAQLSVEATPDDHWHYGGSWSARTLDLPIAAVVVGVHADRGALDLGYRVSESREFGATAKREAFSDGNVRDDEAVSWRERWIAGPVYRLDTRLELDTSSNTRAATNYFNPLSDVGATLTLQNQWQQFRHYDRALTHQLDVTLGDYQQQRHGSGAVAALRYTLNYDVNDRVVVRAGIGRGVRPYDGSRERLDVLTLYALGRF